MHTDTHNARMYVVCDKRQVFRSIDKSIGHAVCSEGVQMKVSRLDDDDQLRVVALIAQCNIVRAFNGAHETATMTTTSAVIW